MLKLETEKGVMKGLEIEGDIFDICADTLMVIRSIYTVVSEQNKEDASDFAMIMKKMVAEEKDLFEPFEADKDESQQ